MPATIIFDLDGVLVDSRPGIVACVNRVLNEAGFAPYPASQLERIIGPPLQVGFATLLGERGGEPSLASACVQRYRMHYESACLGSGTLMQPGVRDLLSALRSRSILAIATSKPLRFTEPILDSLGIRDLFEVVAGPTERTDGENKSATLARALTELVEYDSAHTWMIGDRYHDMQAAIDTHVRPIGATWGFGSEDELRTAGAEVIVRKPRELVDYFLGVDATT